MTVKIINADVLDGLKQLPDESVHCIVTSPPYYALRDYKTGTWEGGDPECDHQAMPMIGPASTLRLKANGEWRETYKEQGEGVSYKKECKKCGAIRKDRQIGLEDTPQAYVEKMVEVFREARRVLRKDGTLWLNLGDSYAGSWGNYGGDNRGSGSQREITTGSKAHQKSYDGLEDWRPPTTNPPGLKPKDLCGIPWRVAFALQAD